ncbi:CoA-transferase [Paeniglutamicibacter sulfureus]|uniref:CoA transferase subunit A n=1 Tax=Paeniglutamicibacter sulfureus TaxID=43666 RepID=UPI002666E066|nr:CoA-transferase [Paeniglutamicibacter sulfureus]MDO2934219.1 CoA-transferase [Paeniglutamicibacter sulfureus]
MPVDKCTTLSEAVAEHVRDGQIVAIEGFGHLVPVAAAHEIIRQGFRNLTLARMTGDVLIDQLLAADCLKAVIGSFVGNSSAGSLHELRRRVENADPVPLDLEEYSHGGMICRYLAGASKLPFYPINSYRGSDLVTLNGRIRSVTDPYDGQEIHVVPALNPDVSIIHAQRADRAGNIQAWGILGVQAEAAFAGKKVIVTVEEIVDDSVVRSDPNRTIVPSHAVDAVVHCPRGAHPHSVQGYYDRDDGFSRRWSELARDPQRLREWVQTNIRDTRDHGEYIARLGPDYWDRLEVEAAFSVPVNYGGRK